MSSHISVLINQVIHYLDPKPGKVILDCTLGLGGHTEEILKYLKGEGCLYGIEVDERNLVSAKERLKNHSNVHFIRDNFENLAQIGEEALHSEGHIDGILFDLGLSSPHIDDASRGFSFQEDGPLDMRFDTRQNITAAHIINTYSLKNLTQIFQAYGEEKFSYRIASKILEFRKHKPFTTTKELADFIFSVVPKGRHLKNRRGRRFFKRIHPATRVFQALRIAANREIEVLEFGLNGAVKVLSKGGRLVVISYHSLEDRLVKNFFKAKKSENILKILTKKPIRSDQQEIEINRRSRSAKLRAAEKLFIGACVAPSKPAKPDLEPSPLAS